MREQVLTLLDPRGPVDRMRRLLTGGLTARQVHRRLEAPSDRSLREVTLVLDELVQQGRVKRRRLRLGNSLVDVYRLS